MEFYCSHLLEYLSLKDFRIDLKNTYESLKKEGIFRCIVPDLEYYAKQYIYSIDKGENTASIKFLGDNTLLGTKKRQKGLKAFLQFTWGNSSHLWMWDKLSLAEELRLAGFSQIRECKFNDSADEMFQFVENKGRFADSVCIECRK